MKKEIVEQAVDTAPKTLVRTTVPAAIIPHTYENIRGLDIFSPLGTETEQFIGKLKADVSRGRIEYWSVTAKDLFQLGLEIPKSADDHDGYWYTSLVYDFCSDRYPLN